MRTNFQLALSIRLVELEKGNHFFIQDFPYNIWIVIRYIHPIKKILKVDFFLIYQDLNVDPGPLKPLNRD